MPFGPYADFDECVAKNADKSSPEGFCAWLHHKITGTWPTGMSADKFPLPFMEAYDQALTAGKSEKEAYAAAEEAAKAGGFELTRFGWLKQFQAPNMKTVASVDVFAAGTWTDSAGFTRNWTGEDLDNMVKAFEAGVPAIVPVKCGHTDDEFNRKIAEALDVPVEVITGDQGQGQISIGKMTSLHRRGDILTASFDSVPEPIANLIEGGQYSTVSVEIEDQVGDFGPVITGVALLGAEEPAVDKATLERALVFGGARKGARVWSFRVGDDLPDTATLRKEFEEIRDKVADVIKGKRGAPIFRAIFGKLAEMFEGMVGQMTAPKGGNMTYEPTSEELLQKGKPPKEWWDKCVAKVSGWPGVNDVAAFCGSVWFHDDPIPSTSFASEEAANQAETKFKEGGRNMKTLPKAIANMKAEEIRGLNLADLVKKFQEGEVPQVEELQAAFQDMSPIAAALGLGAEATVEEIVAAIQALVEKAAASAPPPEGEMAKEFQKASTRIAELETDKRVRDWEDRTREFTAIPGTAHEHAVKLATIEGKAGKETAEIQYGALKEANRLAADATRILGTARKQETANDFDNEVAKYQEKNPNATKAEAIKAISKARPDLYFARG